MRLRPGNGVPVPARRARHDGRFMLRIPYQRWRGNQITLENSASAG
jgi:hypothetical protein